MSEMKPPPDIVIEAARVAAMKSPCSKSKRGVVAFDRRGDRVAIVSDGFNGQPPGFGCANTVRCRRDCARLCMHAEQRAIMRALVHSGDREHGCFVPDLELLHVKVVGAEIVHSKGPGCEQCSRMMLDVGVLGIWLYELEDIDPPFNPRYVWRFYDAESFHRETLRNLELGEHSHG